MGLLTLVVLIVSTAGSGSACRYFLFLFPSFPMFANQFWGFLFSFFNGLTWLRCREDSSHLRRPARCQWLFWEALAGTTARITTRCCCYSVAAKLVPFERVMASTLDGVLSYVLLIPKDHFGELFPKTQKYWKNSCRMAMKNTQMNT